MQAKAVFNAAAQAWEVRVDARQVERFNSADEAQSFADFVNSMAE